MNLVDFPSYFPYNIKKASGVIFMKNKKSSYTEIMKSRNTMSNVPSEHAVLDMYIQMVLDEALFIRKKSLLEERINDALDTKNKKLFMTLSKEYKNLRKLG